MATQLLLLVRALNLQVSMQDFTVCIICSLESLGAVKSALTEKVCVSQIGVGVFTDKDEGENFT